MREAAKIIGTSLATPGLIGVVIGVVSVRAVLQCLAAIGLMVITMSVLWFTLATMEKIFDLVAGYLLNFAGLVRRHVGSFVGLIVAGGFISYAPYKTYKTKILECGASALSFILIVGSASNTPANIESLDTFMLKVTLVFSAIIAATAMANELLTYAFASLGDGSAESALFVFENLELLINDLTFKIESIINNFDLNSLKSLQGIIEGGLNKNKGLDSFNLSSDNLLKSLSLETNNIKLLEDSGLSSIPLKNTKSLEDLGIFISNLDTNLTVYMENNSMNPPAVSIEDRLREIIHNNTAFINLGSSMDEINPRIFGVFHEVVVPRDHPNLWNYLGVAQLGSEDNVHVYYNQLCDLLDTLWAHHEGTVIPFFRELMQTYGAVVVEIFGEVAILPEETIVYSYNFLNSHSLDDPQIRMDRVLNIDQYLHSMRLLERVIYELDQVLLRFRQEVQELFPYSDLMWSMWHRESALTYLSDTHTDINLDLWVFSNCYRRYEDIYFLPGNPPFNTEWWF